MLEIKTLGTLEIQKNGERIDFSGSSKAEAILVYVALEGRQQSRVGLATMFWPESSDKNASASLRVALSVLRKSVGEYLKITRDLVKIKREVNLYLDVQDFETKLARAELAQAIDLYRGDLLAGIDILDSNEFENWRRWEQERLRILLVDAVQTAISDALIQGNYKNGQTLASDLLKIDPLNEIALQQFMLALALDGKRTDALKHYQHCCEILMTELGVEPSPETENIRALISQGNIEALSQLIRPANNLPNFQTSFVGREEECARVGELLHDENCRLLTLIGPGGVGKSRLALHVAQKVLNVFTDGVFFIPLERISTPDFIIPAIAESLQFDFDDFFHKSDTMDQLIGFLENRSILLILDGYEHLLAGNPILAKLLKSTKKIKILVTSRQKINIQGEWAYQITGLPIQDNKQSQETDSSSSMDLFIDRARQANPAATLSEEDLNEVIRICRQVGGFPLGIELAAAWTAVLSCREIADEIARDLDFLESPRDDISERQRSLRATFNYSWQMLNKEQQAMLAELSVFRGGFSRQAVGQVAGTTLTNLSTLLDKSLLQRMADGRIGMHRLIQHFTQEKLSESPEKLDAIHEKHCQYYIDFLLERERDLDNDMMVAAREEVRQEIENLRKAINWAVLHWEADDAVKAVRAYFAFFLVQGWHEGVIAFRRLTAWIRENMPDSALDDPVLLSVLAHQGWFSCNLGLIEETESISNECLSALQRRGMDRELSLCLHNLGVSAEFRGEYERSRQLLEDSISIGKKDLSVAFPSYYLWLGYIYFLFGEYDEGMQCFKTSYRLFNENGNAWAAAFAVSKMGLAADGLGEHAAAMEYFKESYQIFLETGDLTGQGYSLSRMSSGAYFLEDYEKAVAFGKQAYELFMDISHRFGMSISLCRLGFAYLGMKKSDEANKTFHTALNQSDDSQLTHLSLYSLAGIASVLATEDHIQEGWELFSYVKSHPKTPALYIDVASRWFQNVDLPPHEEGSGEKIAPLSEVITNIRKRPGIFQAPK